MFRVFQLIWWLAPAGLANMTLVGAMKIWPKWSKPLDGGKNIGGKRILGDHKTVRGMVTGIAVGTIVFLLQKYFIKGMDYSWLPDYTGSLMAMGALAGDSLKSFFKRRVGVDPGRDWFPWDQIDWIVGFMIFLIPVYRTPLLEMGELLVLALGLHLVVKQIGRWIKLE